MSADRRQDWKLWMLCAYGWQCVTQDTLATCRRERDFRLKGTYWTDWSIRRPEEARPATS